VEGTIRAQQQIVIARGGSVAGDLHTREAIVGGRVTGAIFADDRVEVQRGSVVNGDITAQRIMVQEGGEVNGHVRMGAVGSAGRPSSPGPERPAPVPFAPSTTQRDPQPSAAPRPQ
jgi:cytoskeletal protein CcmA (bactofilin family)